MTEVARDKLLNGPEAAQILGISPTTFQRRVNDGTVPRPLKIGALSRWLTSDILAVIENAKSARS